MTLLYAALLFLAALGLGFLEIFVPSAGMIAVAALGAAAGAVALGFMHSLAAGFSFLFGALAAAPLLAFLGFRIFPRTAIGRRMLLPEPDPGLSRPNFAAFDLNQLLGQAGTALSPLRPAGSAEVGEHKVDVVSECDFLEKGTPLRVVKVEGNRVVVRKESP